MINLAEAGQDREMDREGAGHGSEAGIEMSFCLVQMGEAMFGIDTTKVREVLGRTDRGSSRRRSREVATEVQVRNDLRRVPLAPAYVAGVIPYRGDVLTILSLRTLLGDETQVAEGCVLVLDDGQTGESLGLLVDAVSGVVTVREEMREPNPCTLDERGRALFDGVYKMPEGIMVRIDAARLNPARLAESGAFERRGLSGGAACVR